jgi:SH3-like domain-containing protein
MDAWEVPDPAAAASSELEGGVEVQVAETSGEWAKVVGENGWEGWVDGRLLEQLGDGAGDRKAFILLGIALAVLLILAILGWTA